MPPEFENTIDLGQGTLIFTDLETGTETAVPVNLGTMETTTEIPTMEMSQEARDWFNKVLSSPEGVTFTVRLQSRKMSRKRFAKLLMAAGVSRNDANFTTKIAQFLNRPYEQCYVEMAMLGGLLLTKDWGDNHGN